MGVNGMLKSTYETFKVPPSLFSWLPRLSVSWLKVGPKKGERPVKKASFGAKGGGNGIYISLFAPLTKVTPSPQKKHTSPPLSDPTQPMSHWMDERLQQKLLLTWQKQTFTLSLTRPALCSRVHSILSHLFKILYFKFPKKHNHLSVWTGEEGFKNKKGKEHERDEGERMPTRS